MINSIPYGRQSITQEDINEVVDTLKSDFLTQGPKINEFENAFAQYVGSKYAVAVCNGTAALHLSVLALNLEPNNKVITTPITFAASANCIRYCGGEVVFSDIDPSTYLLDISKLKELLQKSARGSFSGILAVDFAGHAIDLEELRYVADEHGLWIVEDACHSPGGYFVDSNEINQYCGNGNFADLSVFSFHPVKHIAAGEGGMITTNDEGLYKKLVTLRTHGITREHSNYINSAEFATGVPSAKSYPGWYMEMHELGYNYRITDFQAALGLSQLRRADAGILSRRRKASKYYEAFQNVPKILGQSGVVPGHAYHLYVIEIEERLGLYEFLRKHGIFTQVHYIPCHLMPYYRVFGWKEGDLECAESYYNHCLSLPMFPTLSSADQDFVIDKVLEFLS